MNKWNFLSRFIAGVGTLIAAAWAIFTYVIPDPSVLGIIDISSKSVTLLFCSIVLAVWLYIYLSVQRFPGVFRHMIIVSAYLLSAFGLYMAGVRSEDPLLARDLDGEDKYEEISILRKSRIVSLDGIRIQLDGCRKDPGRVACHLVLLNDRADRNIWFGSSTRAFDSASNELEIESVIVGTTRLRPGRNFDVPKGTLTKVTVSFDSPNDSITSLTSLRLRFGGVAGRKKGVKFGSVDLVK